MSNEAAPLPSLPELQGLNLSDGRIMLQIIERIISTLKGQELLPVATVRRRIIMAMVAQGEPDPDAQPQ
jgi:hypothetical protein